MNSILETKRALIKLGVIPHLVSLLRCGPWSPIAEAASELLSVSVEELSSQMTQPEPNSRPPGGEQLSSVVHYRCS